MTSEKNIDVKEIHNAVPENKRAQPEGLMIPEHLYRPRMRRAASALAYMIDHAPSRGPVSPSKSIRKTTVLDVGCGYGDIRRELQEHFPVGQLAYVGVEGVEWVFEQACRTNTGGAPYAIGDFFFGMYPDVMEDPNFRMLMNRHMACFDGYEQVLPDGGMHLPEVTLLLGVLAFLDDKSAAEMLKTAWETSKVGLVVSFHDKFRYNGKFNSFKWLDVLTKIVGHEKDGVWDHLVIETHGDSEITLAVWKTTQETEK